MTATKLSSKFVNVPSEYRNAAYLKFEILSNGIQLTSTAQKMIFDISSPLRVKRPLRARSGASGGLDVVMHDIIFVNAPITQNNNSRQCVVLDWINGDFILTGSTNQPEKISILPEPKFYSMKSSFANIPMHKIAQMGSPDRICYGMTGSKCVFWNVQDKCRFCSIGLNSSSSDMYKNEDQLYEVISHAMNEDKWPAKHILIGGGTPEGPDMGAMLAAHLCSEIKSRFNISVYVMIAAPLHNKYIDALYNAGVDELGINLEFWSEKAWNQFIPGKKTNIGKERYLQALEYAENLFGPIRTRSILVAGLESANETLTAVKALSSIGVMPILSPFRPLMGTTLFDKTGFDTEQYINLYEESMQLCQSQGLPLGPTCICCQGNTLALPFNEPYKWYGTNN